MTTTRTASGAPPQSAVTHIELTVGGMACGACAARVERTLRGSDGVVDAGVNFATSRARIAFDTGLTGRDSLVALVASLGYEATPVLADAPPEVIAVAAGLAGAAGSLLSRAGVMTVAAGAVAGAIAAEILDLHVFGLHSEVGPAAVVTVHAPAFLFLAGALLLRSRLPDAVVALASCEGGAAPRRVS